MNGFIVLAAFLLTQLGSPCAYAEDSDGRPVFIAENPPVEAPSPIELNAAGNYRFREAPGLQSKVQAVIPKGASFEVMGKSENWYQVRYKGKMGYIYYEGLAHPLADALRKEEKFPFKDASSDEVALIAACISTGGIEDVPEELRHIMPVLEKITALSPPVVAKQGNARAEIAARADKLSAACWAAAKKYRPFARHVCKRHGRKYPCGGSSNPFKSKGWCGAGAKECLTKTTGIDLSKAGDSYRSKLLALEENATKIASAKGCDDEKVPVGTACLYTARRHSYGHIEVKTKIYNPKTKKHQIMYCSDFCSVRPTRKAHKFQGAYLP